VRERERAASDKNLNPKESIYILEGLHTDTLEHTPTHTERVSARDRERERRAEKSQPTNEKFSQEILISCFIRAHSHE